jgi:hypothetical protein
MHSQRLLALLLLALVRSSLTTVPRADEEGRLPGWLGEVAQSGGAFADAADADANAGAATRDGTHAGAGDSTARWIEAIAWRPRCVHAWRRDAFARIQPA